MEVDSSPDEHREDLHESSGVASLPGEVVEQVFRQLSMTDRLAFARVRTFAFQVRSELMHRSVAIFKASTPLQAVCSTTLSSVRMPTWMCHTIHPLSEIYA
jgi:hypothetical protein